MSNYEDKMGQLAQQVALAKELLQDEWWARHDSDEVMKSFVNSRFIQMGELVWRELISTDIENQ